MGELSELIAEGIMSRRMIVAEVATLEQEYELAVNEFAILMHEKRQVEQQVERLERALREIEAIDDPDDMGWIKAYVDWAFGRPYDKRLDRPDAWMEDNRPEVLASQEDEA